MAVKVARKNLSGNYTYTWKRDQGDGEYTGIQDRIRIDKDEGYEVLYFIQAFMNKHDLTTEADVHRIEEFLQAPSLSSVVMRTELNSIIEEAMGL
jgi:hypothetical protein